MEASITKSKPFKKISNVNVVIERLKKSNNSHIYHHLYFYEDGTQLTDKDIIDCYKIDKLHKAKHNKLIEEHGIVKIGKLKVIEKTLNEWRKEYGLC